MTTPARATAQPLRPTGSTTCCGRRMSTIEVTSRGTALALHSCAACARHAWVRDGVPASQDDLLEGVRVFLDQPRVPVRRVRKAAQPA